jgi:hypothetical protein
MFWKEWRKTLKAWRKPNLQGLQVGYAVRTLSMPWDLMKRYAQRSTQRDCV